MSWPLITRSFSAVFTIFRKLLHMFINAQLILVGAHWLTQFLKSIWINLRNLPSKYLFIQGWVKGYKLYPIKLKICHVSYLMLYKRLRGTSGYLNMYKSWPESRGNSLNKSDIRPPRKTQGSWSPDRNASRIPENKVAKISILLISNRDVHIYPN